MNVQFNELDGFGSGGVRQRLGRTIFDEGDLVLGLTRDDLDDLEISRDD